MIAFNQIRRSARPKWSRSSVKGVKLVPACFHGFSPPRRDSGVIVSAGAERVLEWWPHSRQQALYTAISMNRLTFESRANGCELAQLSARFEHHHLVVRRKPDCVTVVALYNELPMWGGR